MGTLGKYLKLAWLLLVLALALYPQVAQGEELIGAPGMEMSCNGGDGKTKGIDGSISLAEPDMALAIVMPPGAGKGLVPAASLVQALGGSVTWEGQGKLMAKLPEGDLVATTNNALVRLGEQEAVVQTRPLLKDGCFYLGLTDVQQLWQREATVEGQEIVLLPTADKEQDFVWEELRTFCSGPAWYVVGRVKNTALYAAELTLISWEVGGEQGQVLASSEGYIQFLNPGESKPFKLMLPLRADATWYRLRLTPGFGAKPRPVQLKASAEPYADRGTAYISLLGELTNGGKERQDFIKVMVEFLDEKGRLVDVDWAFLNYLDPGESRSFTVYTPRLEATGWRIGFD